MCDCLLNRIIVCGIGYIIMLCVVYRIFEIFLLTNIFFLSLNRTSSFWWNKNSYKFLCCWEFFGLFHNFLPKHNAPHPSKDSVARCLAINYHTLLEAWSHNSLVFSYLQVLKGYPDTLGALTLNQSPLLVVGGDTFTCSRFSGSISSAIEIASAVAEFAKYNRS